MVRIGHNLKTTSICKIGYRVTSELIGNPGRRWSRPKHRKFLGDFRISQVVSDTHETSGLGSPMIFKSKPEGPMERDGQSHLTCRETRCLVPRTCRVGTAELPTPHNYDYPGSLRIVRGLPSCSLLRGVQLVAGATYDHYTWIAMAAYHKYW